MTNEQIEAAHAETERLSRELNISNADHVALWLETNMPGASLAWLACRIVDAHEAALSAQQATDCPDCDGTGYRQASTAHKGGECPTCAATGDGPSQQATAQKPRPYPHAVDGMKYQETLGFEGGSLTVKTMGYGDSDGNGWFCFAEEDAEWEGGEDGKSYRIMNVPNSELIALRDKLNEVFPAQQATDPRRSAMEKMSAWSGSALKQAAGEAEAVNPMADRHVNWLVHQLEAWPARVDEELTTNITYLMQEAAKVIRSQYLPSTPQPTETQRIVAWQPIEDMPMWAVGVVTDGEHAAMSQKAEADSGGHYFAVDPEDALEWEPTDWIEAPTSGEHLAGEGQ